ncbi:MAG: septum formation protein Maf [Candidatus Peribacter sp.]|jgi:septum formation protein|nr:septum formation protein Maf [Candidatus Peribacter sp.]MBT4392659.1 septum formation protein Maf [Candidatus Peribacter sp.]MBT4600724.1 septum formation protein Maf [Candidatus Peribacter sp.]MBT5148607.1 septum formation protein Maf [Candidatus Peribacter sp.]MBT5637797.1 septum formation protein Maf [Candidatus Peribacter sp.]
MSQHLVLASASPQRKYLLEGLGLTFEVHPSNFDESTCTKTDPVERAKHQAYHKAMDVNERFADSFVIGCDTLVVSEDGELLEKAPSADAAREMIEKLSGKTCTVHSALSVVDPHQKHFEGVSSSTVRFKELTEEELDWWIGTNLWKDRSGSFQIDGPGQLMIDNLEGDWSSVVGLPVFLLGDLLKKAGYIFV